MTRACIRSGGRRALLAAIAAATVAACHREVDLSYKSVVFRDAARDDVFAAARDVIVSHYGGAQALDGIAANIHVDATTGKIETGEIEERIRGETLRERCFADVQQKEDGTVEVALFVPMTRREIDPSADVPVRWITLGSDVRVESLLLEEISGFVLAHDTDAQVVGSNLPKLPPAR